jgi:hypothetical protein
MLLSSLDCFLFLLFLPKLKNDRMNPNTKRRKSTPIKTIRISMEKIRCINRD